MHFQVVHLQQRLTALGESGHCSGPYCGGWRASLTGKGGIVEVTTHAAATARHPFGLLLAAAIPRKIAALGKTTARKRLA